MSCVPGLALAKAMATPLMAYRELVGEQDMGCMHTADEVAEELLACGIAHFNAAQEHNRVREGRIESLFNVAKDWARGHSTKQHVQENLLGLNQWKSQATAQYINAYIQEIKAQIDGLNLGNLPSINNIQTNKKKNDELNSVNFPSTINNLFERRPPLFTDIPLVFGGISIGIVSRFLDNCDLLLSGLFSIVGKDHDAYVHSSNAVVVHGTNKLIELVNKQMSQSTLPSFSNDMFLHKQNMLQKAIGLIGRMQNMQMTPTQRSHLVEQKSACSKLMASLNSQADSTHQSSPRQPYSPGAQPQLQQPQPSSGCFIATMAYGSYDHPQVQVLRRYRDEVLLRSWFGRRFVHIYYTISPTLVHWSGGSRSIVGIARWLLDRLINSLPR